MEKAKSKDSKKEAFSRESEKINQNMPRKHLPESDSDETKNQ